MSTSNFGGLFGNYLDMVHSTGLFFTKIFVRILIGRQYENDNRTWEIYFGTFIFCLLVSFLLVLIFRDWTYMGSMCPLLMICGLLTWISNGLWEKYGDDD